MENKSVATEVLHIAGFPGSQPMLRSATRASPACFTLQEKADPNLPTKDGNSPLHVAIIEIQEFYKSAKTGAKMNFNEEAVIEKLLHAGADPFQTNEAGSTPFTLAQSPDGSIQIPFLKAQHKKLLKQQFRVETFANVLFGPAVDLSHKDLDDEDRELLEWCLQEHSVQRATLSNNRLTARALTPKLRAQLQHITDLHLGHNTLGDEGVSILIPALGPVVHLNLADNGITKDGVEAVAEFAARSGTLKELVLSGNCSPGSPGDTLHSLGRALAQNNNLRWLALARCNIGAGDALLCVCQITSPRTMPFGIDFRGNSDVKNTSKMLRHLDAHSLPGLVCVDGQVARSQSLAFSDAPLLRSIRHLVLEGGGVKGIAYVGVIRTLEAHGIQIQDLDTIAGTSAGAITATLLTVGYTGHELTDVLENLPLESFLDFDEVLHANKRFALDEVKKDIKDVMAVVPCPPQLKEQIVASCKHVFE